MNMKEIIKEIQKANKILLHCHPNPDPDSVGSTLAMKLGLEKLGKKVTLIQGDSEIPKAFQFPGVETIEKKSYGDIDPIDFDLFLILDTSSQDRISEKVEIIFPESLNTIVIDHHASNLGFGRISWVDSSYSSTSEMIYDLIKEMDIEIDHDIALNLFMGIYTDTGGFRYGSNPVNSIKKASELASISPDYPKTIFIMENSAKKESLIFEGLAFSSIKTFYNDKLAIIAVKNEDIVEQDITKKDIYTGYISNKLKSVEGFDVAVTLIEFEKNEIKVSFRTRDENKYDLTKIVMALGGGGHKGAGGANLNMPLSDAIEKVAKTTKEIYNL
jgi:bifunctional oligoribonuclease and PAP phosphatase NrnA